MPLVVRRFRVISELRIVIGVVPLVDIILAKHAREVETEASSGAECNRIVERTPFKLVCGHDVPPPPTAVVKSRFIEHLHACDDHRAVHGIELVRGALASRSNDTGIHEQTNNPAYRCAKSHQDVCGSLSPRGIIHVLEPDRLAKIGPKVSNIQILSEASDIVICDRRRHIDSICHNLHPKHGIGMRIFPREREERDAVQERRTDGHRLVLGSAHRLEHHKAVLDLHMHYDKTAAAGAAADDPVLGFTAAGRNRIVERTAAATAARIQSSIVALRRAGTVIRGRAALNGRVLSALTAAAVATSSGDSGALAHIRIGAFTATTATAAAKPNVSILVSGNKFCYRIAYFGFAKSRNGETVASLAAIRAGRAVHTVSSGEYHRRRRSACRVAAIGRSDTTQTAAATAAGSTIKSLSAKPGGVGRTALGAHGALTGRTTAAGNATCAVYAICPATFICTAGTAAITVICLNA